MDMNKIIEAVLIKHRTIRTILRHDESRSGVTAIGLNGTLK